MSVQQYTRLNLFYQTLNSFARADKAAVNIDMERYAESAKRILLNEPKWIALFIHRVVTNEYNIKTGSRGFPKVSVIRVITTHEWVGENGYKRCWHNISQEVGKGLYSQHMIDALGPDRPAVEALHMMHPFSFARVAHFIRREPII